LGTGRLVTAPNPIDAPENHLSIFEETDDLLYLLALKARGDPSICAAMLLEAFFEVWNQIIHCAISVLGRSYIWDEGASA